MTETSLVWLRNDLRVADNPALNAAISRGGKVAALYIHEQSASVRRTGEASRWWLHHSLNALARSLAELGIPIAVRTGSSYAVLTEMLAETQADAVFWNRRYAPGERAIDEEIKLALGERGIAVQSFGSNVLVEPWDIRTGRGRPYSVYGPFLKALKARAVAAPCPVTTGSAPIALEPTDSDYREPRWAKKLAPYWRIGEAAAEQVLSQFLEQKLPNYPSGRDIPGQSATSRLSPHLRFGEISPRRAWHAALAAAQIDPAKQTFVDKFLAELAWRDFNYHQLFHRDDIASKSMTPKYERMRWRVTQDDLTAWQRGQTGIPLVDAGMREMWETGFMQNRVRMLTASFLAKNLLIDWRLGETWFWDCLIDADVANNPGNWQWIAGSGLDAAPFFRIFNPTTQGEKFDTDGSYVRRWVPELAGLPDNWLHRPAEAPQHVQIAAGVVIGDTYPAPMVDLQASRSRALEAFAAIRE